MGLRQCDKCSEMVDEAKAFCPGCGNAFVEEKDREASKFEKMDSTVQFGQTMYNQMLEDMGLNIGAVPSSQKRVETIAPVKTEAAPAAEAVTTLPVAPAVISREKTKQEQVSASNLKWYVLIGIAVIFVLPIALASAILFVLDIWSRWK